MFPFIIDFFLILPLFLKFGITKSPPPYPVHSWIFHSITHRTTQFLGLEQWTLFISPALSFPDRSLYHRRTKRVRANQGDDIVRGCRQYYSSKMKWSIFFIPSLSLTLLFSFTVPFSSHLCLSKSWPYQCALSYDVKPPDVDTPFFFFCLSFFWWIIQQML